MSSTPRTRVSIDSVPLVIQPAATDIDGFEPPRRRELVIALPPTSEDRFLGVRRFEVVVDGWLFEASTESASRAELRDRVARQAAEHHAAAGMTLRAQIPGRVVRVWVQVGQTVERGERLLAIEAMKMENEIRAPYAAVVESIRVEIGSRVEKDAELLSLG
jgi:biotin carboxyl carrier protein